MLHYQAMAKKAMSKKATPKKAKSKARIRHLSDGIEATIMPKKAMSTTDRLRHQAMSKLATAMSKKAMSKMAKKAMSKKATSKARLRDQLAGAEKNLSWLAQESDEILAEEIEALEDLRNEIDERMLALKLARDNYSRILKEWAPDLWAQTRGSDDFSFHGSA